MNIARSLARVCGIAFGRQSLSHSFAALALLASASVASAETKLPTVKSTCAVLPTDFNSWFASKSVTKDGLVIPANSMTFATSKEDFCPSYKWSEQMFLWLVSPVSGGHVFSSPTFYAVSAPNPNDNDRRTLIPQKPGQPLNFAPSIALLGNDGQSVVFDSEAKVHNVVRLQVPSSDSLFRDQSNQSVQVARVAAAADGKPLLLDRENRIVDVKAADNGAPLLRDVAGKTVDLANATVLVDGKPRLVTTNGDVVEIIQAGGDNAVLMAQNKSLVYYLIQVNDVFAYFKTGSTIAPLPTQFPSTLDEIKRIGDFAASRPPPSGKMISDLEALAMEVKSSWVETTDLPDNASGYLTVAAVIPNYVQQGSDTTKLVLQGSRPARLALVGMHVVGTVLDHPEMIWATFEHVNNAPNPQYTYTDTSNSTATHLADGPGNWLFSARGASNIPAPIRMQVDPKNPANIIALNSPPTIGPVDVTRISPWGTASTEALFTANNTDVISINNNVLGMLLPGDVRKNYIMIGATYTKNGKSPSKDEVAGSPTLANSTMETFQQPSNCFGCHRGNMLGAGAGGLSHIWGKMLPLFTP